MRRSPLAGSRIRERRLLAGLKQAELARLAGVSASYLNLIEHNRRPASNVLLAALAQALAVDPALLHDGAEAAQVAALRDAATRSTRPHAVELDRAEEFLGRFPGWAALLAETQGRAERLERNLAELGDRMAHDPYLPAALHEVLSAVTSVRATAGILADTDDLDPDWQRRFHQNLNQDALRLTEAASGLVGYLAASASAPVAATPMEEVEAWHARHGHHIPALETGGDSDIATLLAAPELTSRAGRDLAARHFRRYLADAQHLPLSVFREAWAVAAGDPLRVAQQCGVGLALVLRRAACLPELATGLAVADGSGTLVSRKSLTGFPFPRFSAACPLWPLYRSLSRPSLPVRAVVVMPGPEQLRFLTHAISEITLPDGIDGPELVTATMLIQPAQTQTAAPLPVGVSCRICPRSDCKARREASILTDEV